MKVEAMTRSVSAVEVDVTHITRHTCQETRSHLHRNNSTHDRHKIAPQLSTYLVAYCRSPGISAMSWGHVLRQGMGRWVMEHLRSKVVITNGRPHR
jgi:hypothetical protein